MVFGLKKEKVKPLPQLPVLAVCPPSRPHTPRSIDVSVTGPAGSASHSRDDQTATTTDCINPVSQTPTASPRHRSFSVTNGLLSPVLSPGSPKPSHWSVSSGDASSFISDYSISETHSLCESPTRTNFAASSQPSTPYAEDPGISTDKDSQLTGPRRTVYHIYHSGYMDESFSIHLASDSRSTSQPKKKFSLHKWTESEIDPRVPIYYLHKPRLYGHIAGRTLRWGGDGRDFIRARTSSSKKKYKRDMKYAPAICHISGDLLWRNWEIEFTVLVPPNDDLKLKRPEGRERLFWRHRHSWASLQGKIFQGKHTKDKSSWIYKGLNEPGVMDGRGLINSWYPFRKGPYRWRAGGETGKEWVEKEVTKRKMRRKSTSDLGVLKNTKNVDEGDMKIEEGDEVEMSREEEQPILLPPEMLPKHLLPIQLDPVPGAVVEDDNLTGSAPMPTPSDVPQTTTSVKGPPHPSKLNLGWPNIFLRDYPFTYLSVPFYWRGTSHLHEYQSTEEVDVITKLAVEEARKKEGIDWCMLAHLKLVVTLPRSVVDGWGEIGARVLGHNASGMCVDNLGEGGNTEDLEGGLRRLKKKNRSLSIFSSRSRSTTRRNTLSKEEQKQEQLHQNVSLELREKTTENSLLDNSSPNENEKNSVRNGSDDDGRSQDTSNQAPPSQQLSPTRSSTWGTFSSSSTLVWPRSRSNTTLSQMSTVSTNTLASVSTAKANASRMEKGKYKAPEDGVEPESKEDLVEVVLARYQCVLAHRKAGRLVIDEDVLERVARYVYDDGGKVKVLTNPEGASGANVVKGEGMKEGKGKEGSEEKSKEEVVSLKDCEGASSTIITAKDEQTLGLDEMLVKEETKTINPFLTSPILFPYSPPNFGEEIRPTFCEEPSPITTTTATTTTAANVEKILGADEILVEEGTTKTLDSTNPFFSTSPTLLSPLFSSPSSLVAPASASPEPCFLAQQQPGTLAEPSKSQRNIMHTPKDGDGGEQAESQHHHHNHNHNHHQKCEDQPQGLLLEDLTTQRERLRHVVVATVMCLIIAEEEKREWVREIILAAVSEGAGAA